MWHAIPAGAQATPLLVEALSRKVHGAAGTFNLPLSLTPANPTTEPRLGPDQTVVFVFDKPVAGGTAVVTEGTATMGAVAFSGAEMIVPLTGVTNLQYVTVAVTQVVAADGGTGGSGSVRVGYLAGDVSRNRAVTLSDLGQVNAQIAQSVTAANFLKDVNASGTLSLSDKGITNTFVTKVLGAVPAPANAPPQVNAGANQTVALSGGANLTGSGSDDSLPGPLSFAWTVVSGPGAVAFGTANVVATSASFGAAGVYVLRLTTSDGALTNTDDVIVTVNPGSELPPDPASVAPPIDRTVATHIGASTAFLYTGANPIQTGVAPGTIELKRVAVLRGRVLDRDGAALTGVKIDILGHPEFGQTRSRADGWFDVAVNGGGVLAVSYSKQGYLPVQRQAATPWQDYVVLDDVVMIPVDAQVTTVTSGAAAMQVARGSVQVDASGARRGTVLFPAGTTAALVQPDGSTVPATTLNVRLTEYTVGPMGPQAMPGLLPPASAYTYAIELSADEAAVKVSGRDVVFNQPVYFYVENFLGFPVGIPVPQGYYDRSRAAWVGTDNGRVIRIAGITNGLADVDSTGTAGMAPLDIPADERQQLAALYPVGQELWRAPLPHFSTWDLNFPRRLPQGATEPNQPEPIVDETIDECGSQAAGSIIECQNQILGESIRIVGTPFTLNYRSIGAPGYTAEHKLRIPLSGSTVPANLERIELDVEVAGRIFRQSFGPAPNQTATFEWDGFDAYGRLMQGKQRVTTTVAYVYTPYWTDAFRDSSGAFGLPPWANGLMLLLARATSALEQKTDQFIGRFDARAPGLGGWTLSPHHSYTPLAQLAYLGDGSRRKAEGVPLIVQTVAGTGFSSGTDADGIPATQAEFNPRGIAVAPDGTVYISDSQGRVRRVGADGIISTFAGGGTAGNVGDGGLATNAELRAPQGLAVGPDGSLYIAEQQGHRIRRVTSAGIITTVAGIGVAASNGNGGPATQASVGFPVAIAVAPDGGLYIAEDHHSGKIRYVGTDGIITVLAGGVQYTGLIGDGGPATLARVDSPRGIALGPDGSVYFTDDSMGRVRRVGPDGVITTVATLPRAVGVAVSRNGALYVSGFPDRVFQVFNGALVPIAGNGETDDYIGENVPATQAVLNEPHHLAVGGDGTVYVQEQARNASRIYRISPLFPGFDGAQIFVADSGGRVVHGFDAVGRHLVSADTLTGAPIFEFTYDSAGRLASVIERTGGTDNVTTVQRDASGHPAAVVGPYGHTTTLAVDGNGFLASITNPANETLQLTHSSGGLLETYTDPRGKTSQYAYDAEGRLVQANDPAGGVQTLSRTLLADGYQVTRTTALGRIVSYKVRRLGSGDQELTNTLPGGESTVLLRKTDGTNVVTRADGTVVTTVLGPDPRFGMQAPVTTSMRIRTPGGLVQFARDTLTATLSDPANLFSLVTMKRESQIGIRTTVSEYTAATRTLVTTTPAGRTRTRTLDALGRLATSQTAGLDLVSYAYDSRGRLATITQGSGPGARTLQYGYDAQGFVQTITDPIGRVAQFSYDAAGRVVIKTLPDGNVVGFGFDAAGNVTAITPPGRPAHALAYSDRNELTLQTPPAVPGTGPTSYAFDADRMFAESLRPDNRKTTVGYDAAGRPITRTLATNGVVTDVDTASYDAAGRITNVAAASGTGTGYAYDGALVTGETWTGAVPGSVARTFDAALRLATQSVNGAGTIAFAYDDDDLLLSVGALTITRNAQNGLPTGSALGVVNTAVGYSSFGELASYALTSSGSPAFAFDLTRDGLGRITQKVETISGVTDTYVYAYDAAGQLTGVTRNGALVEAYGYDSNRNRISATVEGSSVVASHDAQDRLLAYGNAAFAYGAAGELISKTVGGQTTTYQYDQVGNLRNVALPAGTTIDYVIDGNDRRVGKKVNGTLVKGFLYNDFLRPVAELDAAGNVVSRFVNASGGSPSHMVKGGVNFRIVTDHLGSVRLVVDAATGAIVQRLDYDSFGNVVQDTNPGFQPFGFAGGIHDADTNLVRFGARDYDSSVGRWTAKDPIQFRGQDTNLYTYAYNDPVNLTDPTGTLIVPIAVGIGVVVGCVIACEELIAWITGAERGENMSQQIGAVQRELYGQPGFNVDWDVLMGNWDRSCVNYALGFSDTWNNLPADQRFGYTAETETASSGTHTWVRLTNQTTGEHIVVEPYLFPHY